MKCEICKGSGIKPGITRDEALKCPIPEMVECISCDGTGEQPEIISKSVQRRLNVQNKGKENIMTDQDFITRMCKDSSFYQITQNGFILSIEDSIELCYWREFKEDYKANYRDLLQLAIEGINRENLKYSISIDDDCVSLKDERYNEIESYGFVSGIDHAKEASLVYIYEQEKVK